MPILEAAKSAETARAEVAEGERDELKGKLEEALERGVHDHERITELEAFISRLTAKKEEDGKRLAELEQALNGAVAENKQLFEALTQSDQTLRMMGMEPPPRNIGKARQGRRRSVTAA